MSNIIPMVSSSPPPMDEGGGFEWDDDDDDFGTFTSASDTSFAQSETSGKQDTSVHDHFNSGQQEKNFGEFAAFGSFPSNELPDSLNKPCSKAASNDHRPETINISDKTLEHKETSHINTECNSHHNVNGPLVDSGVYSSNVSPVQYTEQSGSQDHVDDTVSNSNTSKDESLHDLSGNLVNNLENTTDETNRSCTDTKCDTESSVSCDASSSVTQENVSVINNSETNVDTEAKDDSVKHIPPKDIPETDHMHISGSVKTNEETRKVEKDESDSVVIANCDDSLSDDSDSKSSNENSHSVSKVARNQESDHGENVSEADLAGEVNECSSDFGYAGSEDQVESKVEDSNNSVKRTEQESEEDSVAVDDESKSGDQQTNLQQQFECSTVSSIELRDSVQEKPVSGMEINTFVKSGKSENVNESVHLSKEEIKFVESMNGNGESLEHKEHLSDDDCKNAVEGGVSNNENAEKDTAKVSSDNDVISNSEEHDVNKIDQTENDCECNLEDDSKHVDNVNPVDNFEEDTEPSNVHFQDGHMPVSDNNDAGLEDKDEFGDFSSTVDTKLKDGSNSEDTENNSDGLDDFNTAQVKSDEEFGGFNTDSDKKREEISQASDGDDKDDFGDFNASIDNKQVSSISAVSNDNDDFGDFNASFPEKEDKKDPPDTDFGGFNATFDSVPNSSEQTNDWAAFSEPQTVIQDDLDDEDDDWAGFEEEECNAAQFETVSSPGKVEQSEEASPNLAKMTKHEKILYAVTTCFPTLISDMEVSDLNLTELNDLHIDSDSCVWSEVKGQRTTEALSYQWAKSLWNTQLFTTLHIDTRNILIGHKKAPVPVFASGLTLLEPTKGQAPLKPDVLVDTSKSDPSLTSHSQESIPAAQFDWSSSGLTNPLEANNKTLNLDFLIQDQATKSNALESEFLSTNESPVHKPAIQPLENILANLKTSSTFKPTNQNEDVSKEASKVLLSLPDLVFMKSKVLMFPVNMNGSEN